MKLHEMLRVLSGDAPLLVEERLRSNCCSAAVSVYHGSIQNLDGTPYTGGQDWKVPLIRKCAKCGVELTAEQCTLVSREAT